RERTFFARWQDRYASIVRRFVASPRLPVAAYVAISLLLLFIVGKSLGTQLFPVAQTGQFQVRIRAPAGTRLERTEDIVREVDQMIREEAGEQTVRITLATVGNAPWEYPINLIFLWNGGPQDAVLLVALDTHGPVPVAALEERLRSRLAQRLPGVSSSFEAADIVSQFLTLGSATPVRVTVSGNNIADVRAFAAKIEEALRRLPMLRDVQLAEATDYPTVDVDIDR